MAANYIGTYEQYKERLLKMKPNVYLHGKKMYYEYRRGERLLNPKQQAWINRLFEQYGYATPVTFDGEKICYDFD